MKFRKLHTLNILHCLPELYDKMILEKKLYETLSLITALLKDTTHPWAFTGSVGISLQGVDLEIGDIDIQTDQAGAYQIQDRLSQYLITPVRWLASPNIQSHFGTFRINEIDVEVMGDMKKKLENGSYIAAPDLNQVIQYIQHKDVKYPVLALAYELEAYRILGRDATVQKIETFLKQKGS